MSVIIRKVLLAATAFLLHAAAATADPVDELFEPWNSDKKPGCSLAATHEGELKYARAFGMANLDHDIANTPETVFHVASVSKQFTAAAIHQLANDGLLKLDDDIHEYLPELPDFGATITIRHLIHHTSGIRDQWELLGMNGWRYSRDQITDQDVMGLLIRQRDLNFPPNTEYLYSNSGYTLLAQIVARVSGQSLRAFTDQRFFKPLGMNDTFFRDDFTEIVKHQAYGYQQSSQHPGGYRLSVTNFDTVGATSLMTTASDLMKWTARFHSGTEDKLTSSMQKKGILVSGDAIDYAHGITHGSYRGQATLAHGGADAGYRAFLLTLPAAAASVAVLCNTPADTGALALKVVDLMIPEALDDLPAPIEPEPVQSVELEPAGLSAKTGAFFDSDNVTLVRFSLEDNVLQLEFQGDRFPMTAVTERKFQIQALGSELEFSTDDAEFTVNSGPFSGSTAHRLTVTAPAAEIYTGVYQASELEIPYHVVSQDDQLTLQWLKSDRLVLTFVGDDTFVGDRGTLRFKRNLAGKVTGFKLDSSRIRGLQFHRTGGLL